MQNHGNAGSSIRVSEESSVLVVPPKLAARLPQKKGDEGAAETRSYSSRTGGRKRVHYAAGSYPGNGSPSCVALNFENGNLRISHADRQIG